MLTKKQVQQRREKGWVIIKNVLWMVRRIYCIN